jgi:AcrR family transcriptional regulator
MSDAGLAPDRVAEADLPAASQREAAKQDRRRRIVEAACDMLREAGVDAVSGKLIAERAGVSLSTLYNLFGSKDAVLAAVFDEDLARYQALMRALPPQPALTRLFEAVDVAADLYRADPDFYRTILWRRPKQAGTAPDLLRQPRNQFWQDLVAQARQDGDLRPFADAPTVSALLIRHFSAALADWIAGELTLDALQTEVKLGFATALLPFASRREAPALKVRLLALHAAAAKSIDHEDGKQ